MSNFPFATVAFDLDGTLLETHRDLGAAVNHALALGGFAAIPADSATDLIGGGAKIMLQRALEAQGGVAEEEFRRLYKAMLAFYADNNAVHTRPYPHAVEVLAELAGRGAALAVVTNKFEAFARSVLGAVGLADRFAVIVGGDSLGRDAAGNFRAKPAPDPLWHVQTSCGAPLVFVGDSSYDVRAARAAGVPVVAACYGYCDAPGGELGADAAIDSLAELVAVLERL